MSVRTNPYLKWSAEIASNATKGSVKTFTINLFPDSTSPNRDARSSSSSTMPINLRSDTEMGYSSSHHFYDKHSIGVKWHAY